VAYPNKRAGEDRQQRQRSNGCEQPYPGDAIKDWPLQELDGLMSREVAGAKVILPLWHNITFEEVKGYSPMLSGRVAAKSSDGLDIVVRKLREAMGL